LAARQRRWLLDCFGAPELRLSKPLECVYCMMTSDNARNSVAPPNLPMHHPTEPVPALHLTTSHNLNYPMQQDPSFPQYQRYINILRSLTQYPLVLKNLPPLHLSSLLCLHTILHGHHPILHDHPPQLHTIMTRHYYHSI